MQGYYAGFSHDSIGHKFTGGKPVFEVIRGEKRSGVIPKGAHSLEEAGAPADTRKSERKTFLQGISGDWPYRQRGTSDRWKLYRTHFKFLGTSRKYRNERI